jgi:hypothetical protein
MVSRSRFFVASLWAAMAPVGMLVAGAVWVVLFPGFHELGQMVLIGGGLTLIGVPFAYTGVVVATYGIGRGLYELRVLNRTTLISVYCALAVAGAVFMTWLTAAGETVDIARSFALFLVVGLVSAGSAAFVWWRVASRGTPGAPAEEELRERVRVRRRKRKSFFRRLASKL